MGTRVDRYCGREPGSSPGFAIAVVPTSRIRRCRCVNAEDAGKEPTTVKGAVLLTGGAHDSTNLRASAFAW